MRAFVFLLACVSTSSCSETPRPALPGLVLQLEFEDGFEPVAQADLACVATTTGLELGPGVDGQGLHCDGSGANLALRGLESLGLTTALTLEGFVQVADWRNPHMGSARLESLVSHSDDFTIAVVSGSWSLQASLATTASEEPARLAGGVLTPGAWHHVALVFDGVQGRAFLALDGVEVSSAEASGDLRLQPGLDLVIGTWFKQNQAFRGALDSIRLWNKALSPAELAQRAARVPAQRESVIDG